MTRLAVVVFVLFSLSLIVFISLKSQEKESSPPTLTKNFVDLEKIEKISKYRSCQGHIVVPTDASEIMRNMKHYVLLKEEFRGVDKVKLFAPYDAYVSSFANTENGLEGELWFDAGSDWQFSIEHINIIPKLKSGGNVKAGDLVGYSGPKGFDIVFAVGTSSPKIIDGYNSPFAKLDSPFFHMNTETFSQYQRFGIQSPEVMVYTKEYRDNNMCKYRDLQGGLNDIDHPADWFILK